MSLSSSPQVSLPPHWRNKMLRLTVRHTHTHTHTHRKRETLIHHYSILWLAEICPTSLRWSVPFQQNTTHTGKHTHRREEGETEREREREREKGINKAFSSAERGIEAEGGGMDRERRQLVRLASWSMSRRLCMWWCGGSWVARGQLGMALATPWTSATGFECGSDPWMMLGLTSLPSVSSGTLAL